MMSGNRGSGRPCTHPPGKFPTEGASEELNHFEFNIIRPKTPDSIPLKGSAEEIISREEVKNWFIWKLEYENNTQKENALLLGQCTKGSKKNTSMIILVSIY